MNEDHLTSSVETTEDTRRYPAENGRWSFLVPVFIVLMAIAIRILFTIQVYRSPWHNLSRSEDIIVDNQGIARQARDDGTDMEAYDYIARWVLMHGWFEQSADASPLYPYAFLPLAHLATGSSVLWSTLIQAFFDGATVLLIYLIALKVYHRRAAIYAGLIAAVYAPFIVYQAHLLGEFLQGLIVAALMLVLLGVEGRMSWRRALGAGVLFGLAALSKPTFLVLLPLSLLWLWIRAGGIRRVLAPAAVMLAAALVVILPFTWRNYRGSGELILIRGNSGKMLYMGNNPLATGGYGEPRGPAAQRLHDKTQDMPLREKDAVYTRAAIEHIRNHPRHFLRLLKRKFGLYFGAEEIANNVSVTLHRQRTFLATPAFVGFGFVLPLAITGFAFSLKHRGVWLLAGQAAVYSAAIILIVVVGRYRLAIMPLVMPAAGFALSEMILAFKSLALRRTLYMLAVTLVVAGAVNYRGLVRFAHQAANPLGFTSVEDDFVMYHDDSDLPTPYTAVLSGDGRITKIIHVDEIPSRIDEVVVAVMLTAQRSGLLTVTLNGIPRGVPVSQTEGTWLYVSFPPGAAEVGFNSIDLEGDGQLVAFIFADDIYRFARSFYNPPGSDHWLTRDLDIVSYRTRPSLHMGGNEFKIRIAVPVEPSRAEAR